jgi:hypothetical protein
VVYVVVLLGRIAISYVSIFLGRGARRTTASGAAIVPNAGQAPRSL